MLDSPNTPVQRVRQQGRRQVHVVDEVHHLGAQPAPSVASTGLPEPSATHDASRRPARCPSAASPSSTSRMTDVPSGSRARTESWWPGARPERSRRMRCIGVLRDAHLVSITDHPVLSCCASGRGAPAAGRNFCRPWGFGGAQRRRARRRWAADSRHCRPHLHDGRRGWSDLRDRRVQEVLRGILSRKASVAGARAD